MMMMMMMMMMMIASTVIIVFIILYYRIPYHGILYDIIGQESSTQAGSPSSGSGPQRVALVLYHYPSGGVGNA